MAREQLRGPEEGTRVQDDMESGQTVAAQNNLPLLAWWMLGAVSNRLGKERVEVVRQIVGFGRLLAVRSAMLVLVWWGLRQGLRAGLCLRGS